MLSLPLDARQIVIVALVIAAFAFWQKYFPADARQRLRHAFSSFTERRLLAASSLCLGVIVLRLSALPFLPIPLPGIHDEFSYLLMADTFAHGRLSNPPHPMWMSFETFHVNWFPRYASMYPPAQGAALALGQMLGNPWIGVLLSVGLMCAAIYWMLCAWIPSRWAFLGALLAGVKLGIAGYWVNSYWGGAVAATGGALVLGALPRILKRGRMQDGLVFAMGLAILANSRPYEGLLFSIQAALVFLLWLFGKLPAKVEARERWRSVALPFGIVLALNFAFMGYYNWRLTGDALLLPHSLNQRTYSSAAHFLWQKPGPEKQYNNDRFEEFYNGWNREEYNHTWSDAARVSWLKTQRLASAFFWPGLLLVLPGVPFALRGRKRRILWITLGLMLVGVYSVVWSNAHYAAPGTCLIILLIVEAIRHVRAMRWRGIAWVRVLASAAVALLLLDVSAAVATRQCDPLAWTCTGDASRASIEKNLESQPGLHLVLVRYHDEDLSIHDEWVFNGADIDSQKVIWARELGGEQDGKLLSYYRNRKIWLAATSDERVILKPYEEGDQELEDTAPRF